MTKFDKVKDSGKRENFTTGSRRDTRVGKGRFDLLPPKCIMRLAKHYENGATKYTLFLPISLDKDISNMVKSCTCEHHYVTKLKNIMPVGYAVLAMKRICEQETRSTNQGNISNRQNGVKEISKENANRVGSIVGIQKIGDVKPLENVLDNSLHMDSRWMTKEDLQKEVARFAGENLGDVDITTLTTTTPLASSGGFCVEGVTKPSDYLETMKKVLKGHSITCPMHLYSVYGTVNNHIIIKSTGDRNWELGQPSSRYLDSLLRHAFEYADGQRDEDHITAVVWNAFGIVFNEEYKPELDDLTEYSQNRLNLKNKTNDTKSNKG